MDLLVAGSSFGPTDGALLLDTFSLETSFSFTVFSFMSCFSLADSGLEVIWEKLEDDDEELEGIVASSSPPWGTR